MSNDMNNDASNLDEQDVLDPQDAEDTENEAGQDESNALTEEETSENTGEDTGGETQPEPEITIDYQALIEEKDELYIRLRAEFDNFRRRTAKEKLEAYGDATAKCILELLPVIDNFERAVNAACTDESYHAGMVMIQTQLTSFLTKMGVTEIEALGAPFDPKIHQAIKSVPASEEFSEGTVCEVFQKGYMLGERLVRPVMVAVAG